MATSFSPPARHTATQVPHPRIRILFAPETDSLISLKGFLLATIIYATPGVGNLAPFNGFGPISRARSVIFFPVSANIGASEAAI